MDPLTLTLKDDEQVPVIIVGVDDEGQSTGELPPGDVSISFDSDVCVQGTAHDGVHPTIASNKTAGTCTATISGAALPTPITVNVTVTVSDTVGASASFGVAEKIVVPSPA